MRVVSAAAPLLLLLVPLEWGRAESGAPHLRNRMPPSLRPFQRQVARQAAAYPTWFRLEGASDQKTIALTFDDGPDRVHTPAVLDLLRAAQVTATFFVVGERALRHPELIRRMQAEGHAVGGHGFTHDDLAKIDPELALQGHVLRTARLLGSLLGVAPTFHRPPYGDLTDGEIAACGRAGFITVDWSVDSFDWDPKRNATGEIVARVLEYAHPGAIVLLHSAGGDRHHTVEALPRIIDGLRERGYRFVTVPELLRP